MNWWNQYPGLRQSVLSWLESLRTTGEPWGRYRYCRSMARPWGVESSCTAVKTLNLLGALEAVPREDRLALGEFFVSLQDPETGAIIDPLIQPADQVRTTHPWAHVWDHMTGVVIQTLPLLGTSLPRINTAPNEPQSVDEVDAWLESLPWEANSWRSGTLIGGFMARHRSRAGLLQSDQEDTIVARVMDWLFANQDPETGLWGTNRGGKLPQAMAGLHCMSTGTWYLPSRPLPRPERIIDSILSLQDGDGNFAGGGGCLNYDAVRGLAAGARLTDHRREDILAATGLLVTRIFEAYQRSDQAFSFYEDGCLSVHNSIHIAERRPESDVIGTHMYLVVLREYAAIEQGLLLAPAF